ncbi:hypothetical protein PPL19_12628 [Pseudomonas psychrotolerans L19]|nr:hypothetical protein PPL19_12628 [Pseudomonas psychrotolerans L19]
MGFIMDTEDHPTDMIAATASGLMIALTLTLGAALAGGVALLAELLV